VTSGTGAWEGFTNVIAHWTGGAWESWEPQPGTVAWIVTDQANKTYLSGSWVDFNETTIITSRFSIYKPGTFGFWGPVTYSRRQTAPSFGSPATRNGLSLLWDRTSPDPPYGNTFETSLQITASETFTSTRSFGAAQLYPLYRYVGVGQQGNTTTPPKMPTLVSIEVKVDGDTDIMWSSPRLDVFFSPADPQESKVIHTWQNRPQNAYYSSLTPSGYPVTDPADIRNVTHEFQEYLNGDGIPQLVISLDRINEDPNVATYAYTHTTSSTGVNLQLEPGYLWLCFNKGGQEAFGEGPNYSTTTNRKLGEVTVSMTVTSDF